MAVGVWFGVAKRVIHWGPLIAIGLITQISVAGTYSLFQLSVLPSVVVFKGIHNVLVYGWLFLIFKNFFQAMKGPGFVDQGWTPAKSADKASLQFCQWCQGYKAPRAHHCKICQRCCLKMDHHCPWVNICVGHANHAAFTRFVFYTPLACLHCSLVCANFIYRLFSNEFRHTAPIFAINSFWIFFSLIGCTLGLGVAIAVGILCYIQVRGILVNETQIEEWIVQKAFTRRIRYAKQHIDASSSSEDEGEGDEGANRSKKMITTPFVYPYNLGWKANLAQVINRTGRPLGNGVDWPVRQGSSTYDFTVEQLEQKKEKRTRTFEGIIQTDYDGSTCNFKFGVGVCLFSPCALLEGERIPVVTGNRVHITNWKSNWYYGDRVLSAEEKKTLKRLKGWFPRTCVDHTSVQQLTDKRD